jgi:hypothetical protein
VNRPALPVLALACLAALTCGPAPVPPETKHALVTGKFKAVASAASGDCSSGFGEGREIVTDLVAGAGFTKLSGAFFPDAGIIELNFAREVNTLKPWNRTIKNCGTDLADDVSGKVTGDNAVQLQWSRTRTGTSTCAGVPSPCSDSFTWNATPAQ